VVLAENIAQLQEFWGCGNVPYRRDKPMTSVLKPGEIRAGNRTSMRKTLPHAGQNTGGQGVLSDEKLARAEEAVENYRGWAERTATPEGSGVRWRDAALSRARVAVQRAQWHISLERAQSGFASSL
jgi:hypothetical protein